VFQGVERATDGAPDAVWARELDEAERRLELGDAHAQRIVGGLARGEEILARRMRLRDQPLQAPLRAQLAPKLRDLAP
jgi:hypothetical protein